LPRPRAPQSNCGARRFGLTRVIATVAPANVASHRVLLKAACSAPTCARTTTGQPRNEAARAASQGALLFALVGDDAAAGAVDRLCARAPKRPRCCANER
jgi:hypothetical protein